MENQEILFGGTSAGGRGSMVLVDFLPEVRNLGSYLLGIVMSHGVLLRNPGLEGINVPDFWTRIRPISQSRNQIRMQPYRITDQESGYHGQTEVKIIN